MIGKGLRRLGYYIRSFTAYRMPRRPYRRKLDRILSSMSAGERETVTRRTDYYNKLTPGASIPAGTGTRVADYRYPKTRHKFTTYFFDLFRDIRYFDPDYRFLYLFGDITEVPPQPMLTKSRPIAADNSNANSVIFYLDSIRHFYFLKDRKSFASKKNMLVARNFVSQPHRRLLLEKYFGHPMCDVGQINTNFNQDHPEWVVDYMTIPQQLDYKFVSCIEGNDVATNLKWVMSSNSLAVMPKPKYETWYMEGTLIPGYHYVEIKEDYSDLIDKMNYYISHPEEAEAIISHAHEYVRQFQNKRIERLTRLSVLQKYFQTTGQTE